MHFLAFLLSACAGLLLGLGLTVGVVQYGVSFDQQHQGAWDFVPRAGAPDIDPYRRARVFVEGELPLASGEGFSLRAHRDSAGTPLTGACNYRLSGTMPVARYWTLSLTTPDGLPITHPTGRSGFTSAEIVRAQDGSGAIMIGAEPLAGNWLPAPLARDFVLVLRLYETPLSATATVLEARGVPVIETVKCRP